MSEEPNRIDAELGNLSLSVQGDDPEWVTETFDEKLADLLGEAGDMSDAIRNADRGCQ